MDRLLADQLCHFHGLIPIAVDSQEALPASAHKYPGDGLIMPRLIATRESRLLLPSQEAVSKDTSRRP